MSGDAQALSGDGAQATGIKSDNGDKPVQIQGLSARRTSQLFQHRSLKTLSMDAREWCELFAGFSAPA